MEITAARLRRGDGAVTEESAMRVDGCGDVDVLVGVHPHDDLLCHARPGHRLPPRTDGWHRWASGHDCYGTSGQAPMRSRSFHRRLSVLGRGLTDLQEGTRRPAGDWVKPSPEARLGLRCEGETDSGRRGSPARVPPRLVR